MSDARPGSLSESPWFWAYVFGMGALIALALAAPKFGSRQAQEERRQQGRERAAQQQAGLDPTGDVSTADNTQVTLRPLFIGLAVITSVAWIIFWINRRRQFSSADGRSVSTNIASPP